MTTLQIDAHFVNGEEREKAIFAAASTAVGRTLRPCDRRLALSLGQVKATLNHLRSTGFQVDLHDESKVKLLGDLLVLVGLVKIELAA